MPRMLSGKDITKIEHKTIEGLSKNFTESFGNIGDTFSCVIYGESGHGKTNMTLQMLKELQILGSVLYVSLEEGFSKSFSLTLVRSSLDLEKIKVVDQTNFEELCELLDKRLSAKIVVIDSIQYMGLSYHQYKQLKAKYMYGKNVSSKKIFVFISHCKGSTIDGKSAFSIKHDCMIKIYVKGYIGIVTSRFEKKKNYTIWEKGARDYWGEKFKEKTAEIGKKPRKKTATEPKKELQNLNKEENETITELEYTNC